MRIPIFSALVLSLCLFACFSKPDAADPHVSATRNEPLAALPKVTQIDDEGLAKLLKPDSKPRLINFWATWCGPCREEFPDLVKIAADHKDDMEVVTVSLDLPSEIDTEVPKFLAEIGSNSSAYLLKTRDEDAMITAVSKDWQGALPFTILLNAQGETIYTKQGKFNPATLRAEIRKLP
jgi:thiol-disulfide isomerase/thioredoxin